MSKKVQFFIGLAVLIAILGMILFPSFFTSANPYATEGMRSYVDDEGVFHLEKAPFKPQWGIPMGTDELGRHVWALIVYGTKLTMLLAFFIVIARFALAIPFGFLAGFGSLSAHGIIDKLARFFGTIPTLLLCIILLKMDFFIGLEKAYSIIAFVTLLGFVGFGKLGIVIEERVATIIREPFVIGDIAIGKNKFQIAATTVFKHLYPELLVMFFLEFARALTLLLQLGLFAVFVGNVRFIEDTSGGSIKYMDISYEPEWASMLGAARNHIRVSPWIVFFPAMAFFISVLGLNAFGEGLRWVLSGELKFNKMRRRTKVVIALILMVLVTFQGIGYVERNFGFDYETVALDALELENMPTMLGNENAKKVAIYLANTLQSKGFKALDGKAFIHSYSTEFGYYTVTADVKVGDVDMTDHVRWIAHGDFEVEGSLLDLTAEDLYNYAGPSRATVLLLDAHFYSETAVVDISKRLAKHPNVLGIVWLQDLETIRDQRMSQLNLEVPVFYVDRFQWSGGASATSTDKSGNLISTESITISQTFAATGTQGNNVYAILPGTSETMGEEAIIYGFSYNSESIESLEKLLSLEMSMIDAITESEINRKRTIIVAFFDGTLNDASNGMRDYAAKSLYSQKDVLLYMDFTRIQGLDAGQVVFEQKQSPISRYYAYTFSLQLDEKFDDQGVQTVGLKNTTDLDRLLFFEKGFPTMIVGFKESADVDAKTDVNADADDEMTSIEQLGRILSTVIRSNNY